MKYVMYIFMVILAIFYAIEGNWPAFFGWTSALFSTIRANMYSEIIDILNGEE